MKGKFWLNFGAELIGFREVVDLDFRGVLRWLEPVEQLKHRTPCALKFNSFGHNFQQFCTLEACLLPMGLTSENVAAAYNIARDRQDIMAADSHKKVRKS